MHTRMMPAGIVAAVLFPSLSIAAQAVTQSFAFPTAAGFADFSDQFLEIDSWDSPFPFANANQISGLSLDFSTEDARFNTGVGPAGGDVGVAVRVAYPLSSAVPGNQTLGYDQSVQPSFGVLSELLADGDMVLELHGFENFAAGGFSLPMELDQPSSVTITVQGAVETVTQSRDILQLPGEFSGAGRMRFTASGWSGDYPFTAADQIEFIELLFTTTDADFNTGVGPNGGDPGVGILVVEELASLHTGNQNVTYATGLDADFGGLAQMIISGQARVGIAGFEAFPTFTSPMPLNSPSTLTVTLTGVPEPAGLRIVLLAFAVACACCKGGHAYRNKDAHSN